MKLGRWLLALSVAVTFGCGGCDSESGSAFSETFVPGQSLGGVLLGETYASVVAAHGEPRKVKFDNSNGTHAFFGNTIMITFLDTDGNGQLSSADKNRLIEGIYADGEGIFKSAGVGTGSTPAEIIAVFGQPRFLEDAFAFYQTENGTSLMFFFTNSRVETIIVSR